MSLFEEAIAANKPLVTGGKVADCSNSEEDAVALSQIIPFLVEDMLKYHGNLYIKGSDRSSYVEVDGLLITGQNPGSSEATAQALLKLLS